MANILKYNISKLKKHQSYYTTTHTFSDGLYHSHENFWEMVCQLRGKTKNIVNNKIYHLESGDILIMPPKTIHRIIFERNSFARDIYCEDLKMQKILSMKII